MVAPHPGFLLFVKLPDQGFPVKKRVNDQKFYSDQSINNLDKQVGKMRYKKIFRRPLRAHITLVTKKLIVQNQCVWVSLKS